MANEIVKMVAKKANLSEPIAQIAVDTVLKMIKDKLPSGLGSTIDSFMGSTTTPKSNKTVSKSSKATSSTKKATTTSAKKSDNPLGDFGSIAGALGGLLGKK